MEELYSIGEVARRTGLTVSAIRFYSDAGVVVPTATTGGRYRRYDVHAIARLELVRTLRELGAGLEDIRRLLAEEITLHDLATTHLALVERRLSRFRARRAVLRVLVRQPHTTEQVKLMHKLADMSDDDRDRLIDDFWAEVTDGLEIRDFIGSLHRARLPDDPSAEQLEAWIDLAGMVQDPGFRRAVRQYFQDTFAHEPSPTPTDAQIENHVAIHVAARAAAEAGLPPDSPPGRELADRFVSSLAAMSGIADLDDVRRQAAGADPRPHVARNVELLGRFHELTATINGTPGPAPADAPAAAWLHEAVKATVARR